GSSHEKYLHPFIEDVLKEANLNVNDLDAIAIGSRPGSFTGLRIGVAAAKGICFALDIPLLSVPTMELLARQVTSEADKIVAIVDARRMEVYTTVYSSDYHEITPTHAKILEEDAYEEIASEKLVFVGSGAEKLQKLKEFKSATYLPDAKPDRKSTRLNSSHVSISY